MSVPVGVIVPALVIVPPEETETVPTSVRVPVEGTVRAPPDATVRMAPACTVRIWTVTPGVPMIGWFVGGLGMVTTSVETGTTEPLQFPAVAQSVETAPVQASGAVLPIAKSPERFAVAPVPVALVVVLAGLVSGASQLDPL